jgi:hypothetical protein
VTDALFQLLFSHSPAMFAQGDVRWASGPVALVAPLLALVAVVAAVSAYRSARVGTGRERAGLLGIRLALIGVLALCLARPLLVVRAAVAQQNVVGVLVDDSASMGIADMEGASRSARALAEFLGPDGRAAADLRKRFTLRPFRVAATATAVADAAAFTVDGNDTRLADALQAARQALSGLPVAGLVLVSDGVDTTDQPLDEALLALRADGIPVFTVGVGADTLPRDVQVERIALPRRVLKGSTLLVDITLRHQGLGGQSLTLDVEDEGRLVATQSVTLPSASSPVTVPVRLTLDEAGPRVIRVRVPPLNGELVTGNNVRDVLVTVDERREKILYFEGEPRFELKFLRRAVADDAQLDVVTLQRTADNKYLRLGVESPDELVAGFPRTREELFAYRGLILGSIEAGALTGDQLKMVAEFADVRGGGVLALGGARALSEGGYGGTAVGEALPLVLEAGGRTPAGTRGPLQRLVVQPTAEGARLAVTRLAADAEASRARWASLPPVTTINRLGVVKPAATVLLSGRTAGGVDVPVLAQQRYGRGRTMVFTPQDSWVWQMHASLAVDDMTHETLWRQMLRALVDDVPEVVDVRLSADRVTPGASVDVVATVVDAAFVPLNDVTVQATVTGPAGDTSETPLTWTGTTPGEYRGRVTVPGTGWHEVAVEGLRGSTSVGRTVTHVRGAPGDAEFFDAGRQVPALQRIAEATGGRYVDIAETGTLAEALQYTGRGVTRVEEHELWQMPAVLLLLLALMAAEWAYRRRVGLP